MFKSIITEIKLLIAAKDAGKIIQWWHNHLVLTYISSGFKSDRDARKHAIESALTNPNVSLLIIKFCTNPVDGAVEGKVASILEKLRANDLLNTISHLTWPIIKQKKIQNI